MAVPALCPRCGTEVRPPTLLRTGWECARHGDVLPLRVPASPDPTLLAEVSARDGATVWLPRPRPAHWLVTGVAYVEDRVGAARAKAVALSGPGPFGGMADLLVVSEESGVGLGAGLAGLDTVVGHDPGPWVVGAPRFRVWVNGHSTPLWWVPAEEDRAVLVGEAGGFWLWLLLWPASAAAMLFGRLRLGDARASRTQRDPLVFGARTPRIVPLAGAA